MGTSIHLISRSLYKEARAAVPPVPALMVKVGELRRHEVVGPIATDLSRGTERWLVDIGLESSIPDGSLMATRLYTPEQFSMTAGVNVPLDRGMIEDLIAGLPEPLRGKELPEIIDDRRFAETTYRVALASGVVEGMKYQDPLGDIR